MKFVLCFRQSESNPAPYCVEGDLPAEAWATLSDFMAFSDDAHRTRFARELKSYKISLHLSPTGSVRNKGVVPDDEALSTFLHKYRPIMLQREPTEFRKVCAILVRYFDCQALRDMVKEWQREYSGKALREIFEMKQGDLLLTAESFLDGYLNAFEYHRDEKHRARLSAFTDMFEPDARKALVTFLLTFRFSAVSRMRGVIRQMQEARRIDDARNRADDCPHAVN